MNLAVNRKRTVHTDKVCVIFNKPENNFLKDVKGGKSHFRQLHFMCTKICQ